jgi:hypothetical protein
LICVSLAHQAKLIEAKIYLKNLLLIEPDISKNIYQMLSMFLLSSELKLHIIKGLEKAGLKTSE